MLVPSKLGVVLVVAFALFTMKAPTPSGGLALVDESPLRRVSIRSG